MKKSEPWLLILRPRANSALSPAAVRLRRALKMLQRVYGIQVTHIEELHNDDVAGVLGAARLLKRRRAA